MGCQLQAHKAEITMGCLIQAPVQETCLPVLDWAQQKEAGEEAGNANSEARVKSIRLFLICARDFRESSLLEVLFYMSFMILYWREIHVCIFHTKCANTK